MSTAASRLLAPAILVLLVAGIVASAIVGNDSDDDDAASATSTTVEEREDDEEEPSGTTSTTSRSSTTTSTTVPGATTTTPGATTTIAPDGTAAPAPAPAPEPAPAPTDPSAPPAPPAPADLIVHTSRQGDAIRFSVENAGPGSAPGITLVLSGAPGPVTSQGTGVECSGEGTITCTVAASGVGGIIGFVELALDDDCPLVTASVSSSVPDPDTASNSRSRNLC